MIQEESVGMVGLSDTVGTGRVYDLWEYRKKKPYFTKSLSIHLGAPLNDTYHLIGNIVYQGKQVIAVRKQSEPNVIILVEALIENSQLVRIQPLPELMLRDIIESYSEKLTGELL